MMKTINIIKYKAIFFFSFLDFSQPTKTARAQLKMINLV